MVLGGNGFVTRGAAAAIVAASLAASPSLAVAQDASVEAVPVEQASDVDLLASTEAPKYDYEVYYLDGLGDAWYNNNSTTRYLYIRTDNPEANFDLEMVGNGEINQTPLQRGAYKDVEDIGWSGNCIQVQGGFIAGYRIETDATGSQELRLYERERNNYGLVTREAIAATFEINVIDYDQAVSDWADDAIKRYTTADMDPLGDADDFLDRPRRPARAALFGP